MNGDIQKLYDMLCTEGSIDNISTLNVESCLSLFRLSIKNISQFESILLLKSLIDIHYKSIFLNESNHQENK
jgi:hypothetical protein